MDFAAFLERISAEIGRDVTAVNAHTSLADSGIDSMGMTEIMVILDDWCPSFAEGLEEYELDQLVWSELHHVFSAHLERRDAAKSDATQAPTA